MKLFNRKYKVFNRKIQDVDVAIWENEFKIQKSRVLREQIRGDRERSLTAAGQIAERIKEVKEKDEKKKLETEQKAHEENAKRYEAQMRMIDEQINGIPANDENPGQAGIVDTLASLAELKQMYKDYLKTI